MTLETLVRSVASRPPFTAAHDLVVPAAARSTEVSAIAYDSRMVTRGAVFVALKGVHADGTAFVRDAAARGASLVVSEGTMPTGFALPWLQVDDARLALASLAAVFYGDPSHALRLIGITGTNGKTTTTYLVAAIFEAAGVMCGRIGTIGTRVGDHETEAARTTPEAPDLQSLLRQMVDRGAGACAIEVSSHALALRRADGLRFAAGVFTNLTRDHLDFHRDMEDYFQVKRRLFELLPPGSFGIANLDDRRGAEFAAAAPQSLTYAIDAPADVRAAACRCRSTGWPSTSKHRGAACTSDRRWSAAPTSTTSWLPLPPRSPSTCRSAPSNRASPRCRTCPAGSRSSPARSTTSGWWSTTRIPTMR